MNVTVASGKGGTGKTTVATNFALSLADVAVDEASQPLYLDCDVEEPNAALFLKPAISEQREVGQLIPEIDLDRCTYCGRCAEVCQYHAIAVIGERVLVFPELCHGCGSCTLNRPTQAIHEVLGVMVTEPTPFGLHDLRIAVEVARDELKLPVGVVINRDGIGDQGVEAYCVAEDIPILMRIPLDRRIAEAYSAGIPLVQAFPIYRSRFVELWERMAALNGHADG